MVVVKDDKIADGLEEEFAAIKSDGSDTKDMEDVEDVDIEVENEPNKVSKGNKD